MNECCTTRVQSHETPDTSVCPVDGLRYRRVPSRTLLHQIDRPWERRLPMQSYYFCTNPDCDVVYFGEDRSVITIRELRSRVGQKMRSTGRPLCYCFGITHADLDSSTAEQLRRYVIEQTRAGRCACEVRNPSGQCCLKDFP
jgi:hypothetical protein